MKKEVLIKIKFKDLLQREKKLEKIVPIDVEVINNNDNKSMETIPTEKIPSDLTESVTSDDVITDMENKIKELEKTLNSLWITGNSKTTKKMMRVSYRGQTRFFPYSSYGKIKNIIKEIRETRIALAKEKMQREERNKDIIPCNSGNDTVNNLEANKIESDLVAISERSSCSNDNEKTLTITNGTNMTTNSTANNTMVNYEDDTIKNKNSKKFLPWLFSLPFIAYIISKLKKTNIFNRLKNFKNGFKKTFFGTRKRLVTSISAIALAGITLLTSCILKDSKKNKTNDLGEFRQENVLFHLESNSNNETSLDTDNVIVYEETTKEETTPVSDKNDDIKNSDMTVTSDYALGDTVTIIDNASIYSNSYDATYSCNADTPYFDGNYEREILGVVYELDGNIYTIYQSDNSALEQIADLENKGAHKTAVLVTRSDLIEANNYEGYYDIDSVKVKTRVR